MKISFLLPTRDRLEYLKQAIETVRRQSGDWEIVVSDNASRENTAAFVDKLADERIVYRRVPQPINVTDNWNAALQMSTGDYVLMLGDDDGVLPGYVEHMNALVKRFARPDVVHTGALLFTHPGVDPHHPGGYIAPNIHADFFRGASEPFLVGHERALAAVRGVMGFRLAFNFNMQLSLISRRLIEALRDRGEFFQSSFPDYYATSAAFIAARGIVADPSTPVVIGVTPKSYGFFHLNEREEEGRTFLGEDRERTMPGSNINEGWLSAVTAIEHNFGDEQTLRVNRRRYRRLQALAVYSARRRGRADEHAVARMEGTLPALERTAFRTADAIGRRLVRFVPATLWERVMQRGQGQFPEFSPPVVEGRYRDLLEVFADCSVATAGTLS